MSAFLLTAVVFATNPTDFGRVASHPQSLVGGRTTDVVAELGTADQMVTGSGATAVCGHTCDEILVYETARSADPHVVSAKAEFRTLSGTVRSITWTFPGNRDVVKDFPFLASFLSTPDDRLGTDLVDKLAIAAEKQPYSVRIAHDYYQRTVAWSCGTWKCSAWVLCPYVNSGPGTRPASLYEYRVLSLTVGPERVTVGQIGALIGRDATDLPGFSAPPDDVRTEGGNRVLIFGPFARHENDYASEVTAVSIRDGKVLESRTVFAGDPANSRSYARMMEEHAAELAIEVSHSDPIDQDGAHGFKTRTLEWNAEGVHWTEQLVCSPYSAYAVKQAAWVTYADRFGCRMAELDQSAPHETSGSSPALSDDLPRKIDWIKSAPVARSQRQPPYPKLAQDTGVSGKVDLTIVVDEDGRVLRLWVLRGDPMFVDAAVSAVASWRYKPFLVDGKPVTWRSDVHIKFKLN